MTYCSRWEFILQQHKGYCYPASALYCTQGLETHCTHSYVHTHTYTLCDSVTAAGKINRAFLPHLSLVPLNKRSHGNTQTQTPTQTQWVIAVLQPSSPFTLDQYRTLECRPKVAWASSDSVVKIKWNKQQLNLGWSWISATRHGKMRHRVEPWLYLSWQIIP